MKTPKFFPYLDSATADKMELELRAIRARRQIEEAYQDALNEVRYRIHLAANRALVQILGAPIKNA